jgi:hypothetical protein
MLTCSENANPPVPRVQCPPQSTANLDVNFRADVRVAVQIHLLSSADGGSQPHRADRSPVVLSGEDAQQERRLGIFDTERLRTRC